MRLQRGQRQSSGRSSNWVPGGMPCFGEIMIGSVCVGYRHYVGESLQFIGLRLVSAYIYLRIGETAKLSGMVGMFVGNENLGHLFRLVAECR